MKPLTLTIVAEEVGHGHVTAYVNVELYGYSMELPIQSSLVQLW